MAISAAIFRGGWFTFYLTLLHRFKIFFRRRVHFFTADATPTKMSFQNSVFASCRRTSRRHGSGWRQQCRSTGSCRVLALCDVVVWWSSVTAVHLHTTVRRVMHATHHRTAA